MARAFSRYLSGVLLGLALAAPGLDTRPSLRRLRREVFATRVVDDPYTRLLIADLTQGSIAAPHVLEVSAL